MKNQRSHLAICCLSVVALATPVAGSEIDPSGLAYDTASLPYDTRTVTYGTRESYMCYWSEVVIGFTGWITYNPDPPVTSHSYTITAHDAAVWGSTAYWCSTFVPTGCWLEIYVISSGCFTTTTAITVWNVITHWPDGIFISQYSNVESGPGHWIAYGANVVPEPASLLSIGLGSLALWHGRRQRRRSAR